MMEGRTDEVGRHRGELARCIPPPHTVIGSSDMILYVSLVSYIDKQGKHPHQNIFSQALSNHFFNLYPIKK